ncbi:7519_t:CDS:2 [Ambispora gerdemannii]|uniref:RING-type E3 ubiquitin transferase (cysteine targeting) n=1 Tax=Ambispora gerdemannii TaxID=144530 RepID=A0A9N9FMM3_9GLOM|nr:7519_t:CDS:2 [Ambispora gerdemannii]
MSKNFWSNEWLKAQTKLSEIRQSLGTFPSPPLRIMRVSQLDADLLDNELFGMLKEQLLTAFGLFSPNFKETFEPELLAVLQFVLYRFSIYESGATYGAQLQNMKYRNEKRHVGGLQSTSADEPLSKFQRISYGALTVGGQYVWMRLNRLMTAQGWGELAENDIRRVFWKFMQKVENIYRTLSLANFLFFLYDGNANASKLNNPYETNCGHKYCYYCIKSKLIFEDGTWQCLRCGEEVKSVQRAIEIVNDDNGFNTNHVDGNAE